MSTSPPLHFASGCAVSAACLVATLLLHRRLDREHAARASSAKRALYRVILCLAPALGMVNFLAVTSPPMHHGATVVQHVVVAGIMMGFMELLLLLCYRVSLADEEGGEAAVPAIPNVLEHFEASISKWTPGVGLAPSRAIEGCTSVLARQEIAFWASPPIGCCFILCPSWPCGRRQRPSVQLVVLLRRMVAAYAAGVVVAPLAETWLDGVPGLSDERREFARRLIELGETVVTLLALYSLFITYRLSKAALHAYHTTLKFAVLKALVFCTPLQRMLLSAALGPSEGVWWLHVLVVAETPLLAILLGRAFPASELPSDAPRAESDDEEARLVRED